MSPAAEGTRTGDFVLRGGRIIDPGQGVDGPLDLHVQDGRIAALLTPGAAMDGANDYDVSGAIVAPGLVDLHGHWYEGSPWGIDPLISLRGGVTTPEGFKAAGVSAGIKFWSDALDGQRSPRERPPTSM